MTKYAGIKRFTKHQQEELFIKFAKGLASLKSSVEAAGLIKDLFSEQEALLLARRLYIAELLQEGFTYAQIHRLINVGDNTIAKVQLWLQTYGDGFRTVISRTKRKIKTRSEGGRSWQNFKKKYPMYFWPQLLLEEIVKSANKKERQRILSVVENMKEKSKLTRNLLKILKDKKFSY